MLEAWRDANLCSLLFLMGKAACKQLALRPMLVNSGADGETRTRTPFGTTPSR